MKAIWTTKEGKEIPYKELGDTHLLNIIKFVERRAEEMDGEVIDGGGIDADDIWYIEGDKEDWLNKFGYYDLLIEAKNRKLIN